MASELTYAKRITRAMLRANPGTLFVFGDNLSRSGMGGQAREMRGEPNAVGIPTKRSPSMSESAFFTDDDFERVAPIIRRRFATLQEHPGPIVWPMDGIGTGLAQLERRAPKIWALIEAGRAALSPTTPRQEKGE